MFEPFKVMLKLSMYNQGWIFRSWTPQGTNESNNNPCPILVQLHIQLCSNTSNLYNITLRWPHSCMTPDPSPSFNTPPPSSSSVSFVLPILPPNPSISSCPTHTLILNTPRLVARVSLLSRPNSARLTPSSGKLGSHRVQTLWRRRPQDRSQLPRSCNRRKGLRLCRLCFPPSDFRVHGPGWWLYSRQCQLRDHGEIRAPANFSSLF